MSRGLRRCAGERPWSESEEFQRRALTLTLLALPFVFGVLLVSLFDIPPAGSLAIVAYAVCFLAITWWMLDQPSAPRARLGVTMLTTGSLVLIAVLSYIDSYVTAYWMAVVLLAACHILSVRTAIALGAFAAVLIVSVGVVLAMTAPFAATALGAGAQIGRRVAFCGIVIALGIAARRLTDRHLHEVHQQRAMIAIQARTLGQEVSHRKQAERELKRSLGLVIAHATDGVITYGEDGRIMEANQAAADILGLRPNELCRRSLGAILSGQDHHAGATADVLADLTRPGARLEFTLGGRVGPVHRTQWAISALQLSDQVVHLAIIRDVTEQKRLESELYRRAHYNAATGLPKRQLFTQKLDDVVRAEGSAAVAGVFAVGLDDVRIVQDAFGYDFGQEVLRVIGARLTGLMADRGEVGAFDRVGFLLWVRSGATQPDPREVARHIQQVVSEPIELNGNRVAIGACVGVSTPARKRDSFSACAAVNQAGAALSRARQFGRETIQLHDAGMQSEARRTAELDHALRLALPRGEFRLFFQPVMSLRTGQIASAEALLRWERPGVGLVSPAEFCRAWRSPGSSCPSANG